MPTHVRVILSFVGWLFFRASAFGQCPQPSFSIPDTVCINQSFSIANASTGADRYEWDFCAGDLSGTPTVTELVTVAGASIPTNITPVFDGTTYYAFFFGRENNLFFRLNFGNSLDNTPTVTNLGNLGAAVDKPEPLEFVQEEGKWYALAANAFGNSNLIRLSFGASLTNTPAVTDLGNFGGKLSKPRGLKVVKDEGNYIAIVTNAGNNTLALINLGDTLVAATGSAPLIKTSPFAATQLELLSTAVIQDCGAWYGVTVANATSEVFKLSFGTSLFSLPVVTKLPVGIPAKASLFNTHLVYDGGYVALISGLEGGLFHLDFGDAINGTTAKLVSREHVDPLADVAGFALLKDKQRWIAFATSFSSNKVFRVNFPDPCGTSLPSSDLQSPPAVSYSNGGARAVTLTTHMGAEQKSISKSIVVRPAISVDFKVDGTPSVFMAIPSAGDWFTEWKWKFGDGAQSSSATPTHTYLVDGEYSVSLAVKNVCGQTDSITRKITIVGNTAVFCPSAAFTLPSDTICIDQPLNISNTTIGADRYEWNFCNEDFKRTPTVQTVVPIPSANVLTDITTVFDGTNWYGFASSRDNKKLFRLDFGYSLANTPHVTDLNLSAADLGNIEQMKFVKEGGEWYALVAQYLNNFGVSRLRFGNSLENKPTIEKISELTKYLSEPRGLEIVSHKNEYIVILTNYKNNTLVIVNLGSSITNTPTPSNVLITNPLPGSAQGLIGISLIKECDQWFGVATSYPEKVYKLSFGKHPFALPVISDVSSSYNLLMGLGRVALTHDGIHFLAFVMLFDGTLVKYDFGRSMASQTPQVETAGKFVGDALGIEVVRFDGRAEVWAPDWRARIVNRFSFPTACSAAATTSTLRNPDPITYSQGGWKSITLKAYTSDNSSAIFTDSVFVRPATSASFTIEQQCQGAATTFTASPAPPGNRIKSWNWQFEDGSTAIGATVQRVFASAGTYPVTLTVEDMCGSTLSTTQSIKIYKNTIPDFSAPSTFCSYQPQSFSDASVVLEDTPVNWQWNFGNGHTEAGSTVTYAYPAEGDYSITLTVTGISGCSVSVSKPVTVKPGVNVNFTYTRLCIGNQTAFVDQSTVPEGVEVTSRTWTFGDGTTSNAINPIHEFAAIGTYEVKLTVSNTAGCANTRSETVVVRQLPQAVFSVSLACSGEPTSFSDESAPIEGEISSWRWDFGDPESGAENVATERNPQHTYAKPGTYEVKLIVSTNYGCVDSLSQSVTVTQSPQAEFVYALNCQTKTVNFVARSIADNGNALAEWYWDFGDGVVSATANASHTYQKAGIYTVTYIVTASSRCQDVIRKTVQVYDAPIIDFSLPASICAGQPVTIEDRSVSAANDPIVQWHWQLGTKSSTERSPTITFETGTTAVSAALTVTTAAGCRSTITKQVSVQANPAVSFTHQASGPNESLAVQFTANSVDATQWLWQFGDGKTSSLSAPVHAYSASGTYTVSLRGYNAAGCTTVASQEVTVSKGTPNTYGLKLEEIAVQGTGSTRRLQVKLLNEGSGTLNALAFSCAIDASAPIVLTWKGSLIAGGILNYSFSIPQQVQASAGEIYCVQAKDEKNSTISNQKCITLSNAFSLLNPAPNPAQQSFRVAFILPDAGEAKIEMFDALGRSVAAASTRMYQAGYTEQTQSVIHLRRGMYWVCVTYKGQIKIKSLLVH